MEKEMHIGEINSSSSNDYSDNKMLKISKFNSNSSTYHKIQNCQS